MIEKQKLIRIWPFAVLPFNCLFYALGWGILLAMSSAHRLANFWELPVGEQFSLVIKILTFGILSFFQAFFLYISLIFYDLPYSLFYALCAFALFVSSCRAWLRNPRLLTFGATVLTGWVLLGLPAVMAWGYLRSYIGATSLTGWVLLGLPAIVACGYLRRYIR